MKRSIILTLLLALAANATTLQGVLFKDVSALGRSHNGPMDDIDAYSDGVGAFVKSVSGSPVNFEKFNKAVVSSGAAAKDQGVSVAELAGLTGEDAGKVFTPSDTDGLPVSCKAILDSRSSHGNDVYEIDPDGDGQNPINVYCDMTTDGGGWTLVVAQFENDPATDWNEGIQPDYDPTLTSGHGFALSSSELPSDRTQTAFGESLDPTYVDYVNFVYTTGDIPVTIVTGYKTGVQYGIYRSKSNYYGYHDTDNSIVTSDSDWFDTLTFDRAGGRYFSWAFSPSKPTDLSANRGYSMNGQNLQSSSEPSMIWTVWIR